MNDANFGDLDGLRLGRVPPSDEADFTRDTLDIAPQPEPLEIPRGSQSGDLKPQTSGSTVPLPNRPAANPMPPAQRRAATSYKYTELAEEQVYIPSRLPGAANKGSGGGGDRGE